MKEEDTKVDESRDFVSATTEGLPFREFPTAFERKPGSQVAITDAVLNDIHTYGNEHLQEEICGVLVGNLYRDNRGAFLLIDASVRGEHANRSVAGVTFTDETWTHIHTAMEKLPAEKRIVGWYHTHPGFGIFLSTYDVFIHQHFFTLPWQVAFVYDPCRKEEGVFGWDKGKIRPTSWTGDRPQSHMAENAADEQSGPASAATAGRFDRGLKIAVVVLLCANLVLAYRHYADPRRSASVSQATGSPKPSSQGTPAQTNEPATRPRQDSNEEKSSGDGPKPTPQSKAPTSAGTK